MRNARMATHLGWVDTNWCIGTIGLLTLDSFNVDDEFLSVHLDNFANGVALVVTTHNLIIRIDRNK